jgi:hypothetical protein
VLLRFWVDFRHCRRLGILGRVFLLPVCSSQTFALSFSEPRNIKCVDGVDPEFGCGLRLTFVRLRVDPDRSPESVVVAAIRDDLDTSREIHVVQTLSLRLSLGRFARLVRAMHPVDYTTWWCVGA